MDEIRFFYGLIAAEGCMGGRDYVWACSACFRALGAIKLLSFERETWVLLMEKNAAERGTPAPTTPTSQQTALSAYSKSA